jgi:hypothetical protein
MLGPLSLMLNALVYYLLLMRNWPWAQSLTRPLLHHWFPAQRHRIIDQIEELEHHRAIDQARQAHLLALARGNAQADAYEQTQAILDRQSQQQQQKHQHMRAHLQIPQDEAPRSMLFRLGPAYTPLDTSLVALAFGMLPYVLFLVLSSFQDEVRLTTIQDFLFTTIGVPWGPIYLCFFGYFYRSIWGHVGVTKGLVFGGVLVALGWLYHWMWQMDQMDAIALWGLSMRILVTFVFTGLMMDWMTTRFSWRLVRRSYDSSAVTTVLAIIGTACTTVITGIVTGTLSQMLSFALQATSESLGVPMPEGP